MCSSRVIPPDGVFAPSLSANFAVQIAEDRENFSNTQTEIQFAGDQF